MKSVLGSFEDDCDIFAEFASLTRVRAFQFELNQMEFLLTSKNH